MGNEARFIVQIANLSKDLPGEAVLECRLYHCDCLTSQKEKGMALQKKLLAWTMVFSLMLSGAPAFAGDEDSPGAGKMAADVLIARPIGMAITTVGALAFVVGLPFSALGGNVKQSAQALVVKPAQETFVRCLGCKVTGRYQDPDRDKR